MGLHKYNSVAGWIECWCDNAGRENIYYVIGLLVDHGQRNAPLSIWRS